MEVLGCPAAEYYGGRKGMILEPPGGEVCMGIFGYRRLWSLRPLDSRHKFKLSISYTTTSSYLGNIQDFSRP